MLHPSLTSQPRRLSQGGLIDRSRPYLFRFNGQAYQGYAGDTLASALLANDVLLVARSPKLHRPRGVVAAGADEPNAIVSCNGRHVLATTMPLFDGLSADSLNHWPSLRFDLLAATPYLPSALTDVLGRLTSVVGGLLHAATSDRAFAFCDVLIVGGGPAGLIAALAVGRSGARVILIDDDVRLGGRLTADQYTIDRMSAMDWVEDVTAELSALANVRIMLRATFVRPVLEQTAVHTVVEGLAAQPAISPDQPSHRHWSITAKHCILAPGFVERALVFADNDRPGIMLAGALRSYLNRYAVVPGERIILYATHDEAAATIADVTRAGAIIEAVIDPRRVLSERVAAAAERVGAEVVAGSVRRALGSHRVEGIEVQTLDGATRTFDCDLVALSDGWCPALPPLAGAVSVMPKTALLADCLTAGLMAGLAAARKVGFPDALVDLPETDEAGHPSAAEPLPLGARAPMTWPSHAPLRGQTSRARAQGLAFADFATDQIAQVTTYENPQGLADSADLVTFASTQPAVPTSSVPPPVPPYRRLAPGDVFSTSGTRMRFGRFADPVGVRAMLRRDIAIARLMVRPNQSEALAARITRRIGLTLPPPGRRAAAGHLAFAATKPAEWLATSTDDMGDADDGTLFAQQLVDDLGSFADVIDLTPELTIVDIAGPRSCDVLARGLELDTAPAAFPTGHCVQAALGRMIVTVSCVDAGHAFQLMINRRDVPDFANWIVASGTAFGLETGS